MMNLNHFNFISSFDSEEINEQYLEILNHTELRLVVKSLKILNQKPSEQLYRSLDHLRGLVIPTLLSVARITG